MVWNWLRRHPYLVDVAVALLLAVGYLGTAAHHRQWGSGVPLAVLQVVPLVFRRRYPLLVLGLVTAAWFVQVVANREVAPVATAVGIYTLSANLPRRKALWGAAAAVAATTITALAFGHWSNAVSYLVLFVAAWVIGDNLGTRRAYMRALEERAERAERERESEAARARAEEQARIARELHDVIAHNVSVMVVQAAAGNDVFDSRPDRAREALQTIEASGRKALGEMRRLLGIVRADGAEYAPQPGLEQLDELVEQVRAAGLTVEVGIEGAPRPLPAGIDLSAYRVVQEALTNTLKHARATRASVTIRYREDALDVEVHDDGVGSGSGDGLGHGLIGMRERVATFGGSLDAGPAPAGGFTVVARFPL